MTLDWKTTAHDCAIQGTFTKILADEIWHDGNQWWSRQGSGDFSWVGGRRSDHLAKVMKAREALPAHPYWARVRGMSGNIAGAYKVLGLMALACRLGMIERPLDLNVAIFHGLRPSTAPSCLCWEDGCIYPPIPADAQLRPDPGLSAPH